VLLRSSLILLADKKTTQVNNCYTRTTGEEFALLAKTAWKNIEEVRLVRWTKRTDWSSTPLYSWTMAAVRPHRANCHWYIYYSSPPLSVENTTRFFNRPMYIIVSISSDTIYVLDEFSFNLVPQKIYFLSLQSVNRQLIVHIRCHYTIYFLLCKQACKYINLYTYR
jgi:hypothetical protein